MAMDARQFPDPRRPTAEDIDAVEVKVDDRRFWARQEASGAE